jgi:4-carboxymuconolactone decarboxylase
MTTPARRIITLPTLDHPTRQLLRAAAIIASGDELAVRAALSEAKDGIPITWVEELILQSYLFCGFPRSLNAMREWRRLTGKTPTAVVEGEGYDEWQRRGEATCELVYGAMYDRLRINIRALHPELDTWMIVEGYGKVLSRPALDLPRRELCIVAACAASRQNRQLHSHLHGALNVGVAPGVVTESVEALADVIPAEDLETIRLLWRRVQGQFNSEQ